MINLATQAPARIVVSEADDPRVLIAAHKAHQQGIAKMILVGNTASTQNTATQNHLNIHDLPIEDPLLSSKREELCQTLIKKRANKGMTEEKAQQALNNPLCFAMMLVHCNYADGSVAGAVYNTADVVRSALQLIGKALNTALVSSFFLVLLEKPHHPIQGEVIFSDCGLVIDPIAAIAISAKKLIDSGVKGQANVFIFPNLEAGSIGYKIAERLGGAIAISPLLQGLNKPANALSRGCNTDDVFHVIAVTSLQAQQRATL